MIQQPALLTTDPPIEAVTAQDDPIPDYALSESTKIIAELFNVFFDDWSVDDLDFELYCILPYVVR